MKTYILRNPKTVDPQNQAAPVRSAPRKTVREPARTAAVEKVVATETGRVLYVGLDVHNDSIAVSLAPADSTEVRRYGIIGGLHDDVLKLAKKLQAAHPGLQLKFCYEAGPRG